MLLRSSRGSADPPQRYDMRSLVLCLLLALACGGCASTGTRSDSDVNDPFERANRAIFRFNRTADRFVLRPVANGYHGITPDPLERSISRFFVNLSSPIVIVSGVLQGKFKQAGSDTGRFLLTSTCSTNVMSRSRTGI